MPLFLLALSWTIKNTTFLSELFKNWNSFLQLIYQNKTIWNCWNFSFPPTLFLKKCFLKYVKFHLNFFPTNSNIDTLSILTPFSLKFVCHLRIKTVLVPAWQSIPENQKRKQPQISLMGTKVDADQCALLLYISLQYNTMFHHTWLQVTVIAKTGHRIYSLMIASLLTLSKHAEVESRLQMTAANNTSAHVDLIVTLQQNWIISSISKPGVWKDLKGNLSIQRSEWMWFCFPSSETAAAQ